MKAWHKGYFALLSTRHFTSWSWILQMALHWLIQLLRFSLLIIVNIQVKRSKQLREKRLVKSYCAVMLSQSQPHFLYNSLTSIAQMLTHNRWQTTITFCKGEGNLDSLAEETNWELRHIKTVRKMRFEENTLQIVLNWYNRFYTAAQL